MSKLVLQKFLLISVTTVYSTELINKDRKHNDYFNDFINHFPKSSNFFWTGDKVISLEMNKDSQSSLSDFNNENILIWDNYFTTDSCPKISIYLFAII